MKYKKDFYKRLAVSKIWIPCTRNEAGEFNLELPEDICGIVVEPFVDNYLFDREKLMDFDSLTQGMSVSRNPRRGKVKLMVPGKLPPGLEKALRRFFAGQMGVNRAWILLAKSDMEKFPHLMFAVDFYGSKIELFPKLAEVIKPFMKPGQQFELIEKGPALDEPKFAKAMVYKREGPKQ